MAVVVAAASVLIGAAAVVKVGEVSVDPRGTVTKAPELDMQAFSNEKPSQSLNLLFIHHSCGGQMLAPPGTEVGDNCIYEAHPNGGSLRSGLEVAGYDVHEASYNSIIGDKTDIFDWVPKFRAQMPKILRTKLQDTELDGGAVNQIVAFKSCFPNSSFVGEGQAPGNPTGPELTVANAQAMLRELLPEFRKHPNTLFVYVTAPPIAPKVPPERAYKWIAKRLLGRHNTPEKLAASAALARRFNNWAKDPNGWLKGYELNNVVVFDYYDALTGYGKTDLLLYPTENGFDSHPSSEGNRTAAAAFVPFMNRAVRRAGLSP